MSRIHYDRYIVCRGQYPFVRLGTMNKVDGQDEAHHIAAARQRFAEPHPVLVDTQREHQLEQQALDYYHRSMHGVQE